MRRSATGKRNTREVLELIANHADGVGTGEVARSVSMTAQGVKYYLNHLAAAEWVFSRPCSQHATHKIWTATSLGLEALKDGADLPVFSEGIAEPDYSLLPKLELPEHFGLPGRCLMALAVLADDYPDAPRLVRSVAEMIDNPDVGRVADTLRNLRCASVAQAANESCFVQGLAGKRAVWSITDAGRLRLAELQLPERKRREINKKRGGKPVRPTYGLPDRHTMAGFMMRPLLPAQYAEVRHG